MFNGNHKFECARHGDCIYQLKAGVCLRRPVMVAVDRAGHYRNLREPNEDYPILVDLHWCPARGEEIGDGEGPRRSRGRPRAD